MQRTISIRLSPPALEYVSKLQTEHGGSVSDVIRNLIEQVMTQESCPVAPDELKHIHECTRYTASLVTGLVRKLASADADAMIEKAIADGLTIPTSQPATRPTPIADDED